MVYDKIPWNQEEFNSVLAIFYLPFSLHYKHSRSEKMFKAWTVLFMSRSTQKQKLFLTCSTLTCLGGLLSSKAKRAKCSTHKQRVIIMLYNKVCDIVSNISELLEIQLLTDTTILQVKTWNTPKKRWKSVNSPSRRKLDCKPDDGSCSSLFFPGFLNGNHSILCGECQWAAAVCH